MKYLNLETVVSAMEHFTDIFGSSDEVVEVRRTPAYRYALFFVEDEQEALDNLREAYQAIIPDYDKVPDLVEFDESGNLILREQVRRKFLSFRYEKFRDGEVYDDTIRLLRFKDEHLLKIMLFDEDMEVLGENIMLARYLRNYYDANY